MEKKTLMKMLEINVRASKFLLIYAILKFKKHKTLAFFTLNGKEGFFILINTDYGAH